MSWIPPPKPEPPWWEEYDPKIIKQVVDEIGTENMPRDLLNWAWRTPRTLGEIMDHGNRFKS